MKKIIEAYKLFLWARGLRKKAEKKEKNLKKDALSYEERWILFSVSHNSGPIFM